MQCNGLGLMGSPLAGAAWGVGFLLQEGLQRRFGIPWWGWVLLLGLILIVGVVWVLRGGERAAPPPGEQEAGPEAAPSGVRAESIPSVVEETPPPPLMPDDLKRIEGIGPKLSAILQAAGITTFAQLAQTDVERLQDILSQAGITQISDPTTWPEQARLAAAGDWAGLEALQARLKGGRRVE